MSSVPNSPAVSFAGPSNPNLRTYHPMYENRNGFVESPAAYDSPTSTEELKPGGYNAFLHDYRFGEFVLAAKGDPFPTLGQMKNEYEFREDTTKNLSSLLEWELREMRKRIQKRIKAMKDKHAQVLHKLYDLQAADYMQETEDNFLSLEDPALASKISDVNRQRNQMREMDDDVSRLRYAHFSALLPLQEREQAIEKAIELLEAKKTIKFPESVEAYRTIRNPHVQLQVAKFIALNDDGAQGKIKQAEEMNKFKWTPAQVEVLNHQYHVNPEFKAQILFRVNPVTTKDPRKRREALVSGIMDYSITS